MGRLLAFILGGAAIALYAPHLFLPEAELANYQEWWVKTLSQAWYDKIFKFGPGIFAGVALLLFAVRGKD